MNCHLACARFAQAPARQSAATPLGLADYSPRPSPVHVASVAHVAAVRAGFEGGGRSREQSHRLARTGRSCCRVARAEAPLKVLKEASIEVDLLVVRTIERTHCGLRKPTAGLCRSGKHDQSRRFVSFTVLSQTSCPHFFGAAKDGRDELSCFVRGRSGRNLLLLRLATFGQHLFGAANEYAGSTPNAQPIKPSTTTPPMPMPPAPTRSHVATIFNAIASR